MRKFCVLTLLRFLAIRQVLLRNRASSVRKICSQIALVPLCGVTLSEICTEQRSCGKSKQNKNHVKPRKEIQKRSFWRRFFSSFLSLLKEKRPPEAKRRTDSHASDVGHWLGMTALRGVRGDAPQGYLLRGERWAAFTQGRLDATALPWHTGRCGHRPLRKDKRCDGKMDGGRDTPRVLASLRGHRPLRKVYRGWVRLIYKRKRRVGASFCIFFLPFTFCVDRVELR